MKRALLAWGVVVLPLWALLVYGAYWEPVENDGWTHIYWYRSHELTFSSAWEFVQSSWLHENPRIGQLFTLVLHSRAPIQVIATPLFDLAVFWLATALALGRWPSRKNAGDALAFATVAAIIAITTQQLGSLLFYRPFVGNYTIGLVLDLLWLVPFRIAVAPRLWLAPVWLVLGFVAGMCNEHTGLALLAIGAGVIAVRWRRGERPHAWMIAGIAGFIAGYVLLLCAPGQDLRYDGLATHAGIVDRVLDRGFSGNVHVLWFLIANVARALPWLALGGYAHFKLRVPGLPPAQRRPLVVAALAGVAVTLTLLASPVIGPRLYFASCTAIAIAITGWLVAQLAATWARAACAVLAAGALGWTAWQFVDHYRVVGPIGAERYAKIWDGVPGTLVEVPKNPLKGDRWFISDDFEKRMGALEVDYHFGKLVEK